MGFLQRLRVSSGAPANGKAAAPPLDESLPKPLQGEQAAPPPMTQPPEATAALQPQRPAVKAAPSARLRTEAATANGPRPAYAGRPTANGHAAGRGQPRNGTGVGRGGTRSLVGSAAARPPKQQPAPQQQPGARAGGRGRGRGSPSPARPPPPVRNLSGNRRRPPRSPTVSEKGSMEQIEWERGSAVAISADSRSNSGGALTEEAASPASSRREAPRDPALTPVAQSRHPQTAARLAALSASAAQRPAASAAPLAAIAAVGTASAAPAVVAAAVPPPAAALAAVSKPESHPISAAAAVPPPAPATPDLPSAQPTSAQSEMSPVPVPPLLPQQPQAPAATAAEVPPLSAIVTAPAAPPVPPLVLPVAPDPAAAVPEAEQATRQQQMQKPAAKQAAAKAKAGPPLPKKKSGGLFSCCNSEPATKDDLPAAAADSSTRPRDGSSKGGSRKAAAASEAAAAAAAGRRASGEATAAASAAADPEQRTTNGDATSNSRCRSGDRSAADSQRAAATLERGRTSPDKSVGGRSAKSGKSASSSSPERVPRPGLPGSEHQKQRRPPPPLRNASADATPRRGRASSTAGSQASSVSCRRSSRREDEARGASSRRSTAGSQAGSVSGRRGRYDDQVTPEPRRHRRSSSAASVSSVGSVRSTQSRRSVASAASLHVRGYEHVGPYDPEIGAPRPALKRTGSNASLASRSSAGYSSHDGDPAALHSRSPPPPRGRRHRRDGSSGSLASMDSLGSVGSLHSLAEGEPSDSWDLDAGSPALGRRRRIPSSASLDSFDSASSYGSGVSASSANRDYRAVIKGMDRPMSPLSGGNSLFRGDSLSSGSGSWSVTSSELEDVSSTPGSGRRHRSVSGSNLLSPDRARRSSDSLFNGDLGSPMSPAAAQRSASGNSIGMVSPSDAMSLSGGKAKASPGTQVQQMRQLREKVRAMRAETEAHLGAVTQAAEEARARRASGGDDGAPVSPRPDLARLQEQRAKLQRRLEKLGMQQMRLEQHIAEAASTGGSAAPSPPSSWRSGRTAAAVDIRPGRGGGIGGSGIAPMAPRMAAGKAEDDVASVTSNRTASGGRRSGQRVTFGPNQADAPQEDNFLQVVDTVASLKQLLSTHPSARSPHAQRRRPAATGPVANGIAVPAAPGSSSAARAAARAATKFDYDALGTSLTSGRAGPPPPLKPRDAPGGHHRSRSNGSSSAGGVSHRVAAGATANGGSSSRHRASAAAKVEKATKLTWNDDVSVAGD